jgi:hypothetical protein
MLVMPDALWSAASLWVGTRAWTQALRTAGLAAGDALVCALPEGPAFVQVLLACLWEEITFTPLDPSGDVRTARREIGARAVVVTDHRGLGDMAGVFVPDAASQPPDVAPCLTDDIATGSRAAALCFAATDASGASGWTPYSTADVHAMLARHDVVSGAADARVLSVHPWHEPFGLVAGLLSALLHADEIVRESSSGVDLDLVEQTARELDVTHVALTPVLAEAMLQHAGCRTLLCSVRGGVVGGGAVSVRLSDALRATTLRVVGAASQRSAPDDLR